MEGDTPTALLDLVASFLGPCETPASSVAEYDHVVVIDGKKNDDEKFPQSATSTPCYKRASVIIFSKDRPWQLRQLLRSMRLSPFPSASASASASASSTIQFDITVIVGVEEPFAEGYRAVEREFAAKCICLRFLREEDDGRRPFGQLLEGALKMPPDSPPGTSDGLIVFLTDDCLLLEPLGNVLSCAAGCLAAEPTVLAFLARLHPAVSWCQTLDVPCPPPRDSMRLVASTAGDGGGAAYVFDRKAGRADWGYPFDLSGGIYRHSHVVAVVDWIRSAEGGSKFGYSHPNRLEISGNAAIREAEEATGGGGGEHELPSIVRSCRLNACPTQPFLTILAINRVQDVCQAPLALRHECRDGKDVASLEEYRSDGIDLDIDAYRSAHYNSSHIGDLLLSSNGHGPIHEEGRTPSKPAISVLLPVHKGPPEHAACAMRSIVMQLIKEWQGSHETTQSLKLSPMQIVLVNDRCRDGSIEQMIRVAQDLSLSYSQLDLSAPGFSSHAEDHGYNTIKVSIEVIKSEGEGVAAALNHGLKFCKSDIVARMDADDVSFPGRLLNQLNALRYQSGLKVIGTASLIFGESMREGKDTAAFALPFAFADNSATPDVHVMRISLPSSDPGFVAWAMLFSCSLSHPSVMFRRSAIEEVGGYDETITHAEDYDLWVRLLKHDFCCIKSLPNLGLCHRKHRGSSTSSKYASIQRVEGDKISLRAMQQVLNLNDLKSRQQPELNMTVVSILKRPDTAKSLADLDAAALLLLQLESSFLLGLRNSIITNRERGLIRFDCDARVAELATVGLKTFGRQASRPTKSGSGAWEIWCQRQPEMNLERISLLCHLPS